MDQMTRHRMTTIGGPVGRLAVAAFAVGGLAAVGVGVELGRGGDQGRRQAGGRLDGQEFEVRHDPRERQDGVHPEAEQDSLYRGLSEGVAGPRAAHGPDEGDGRFRRDRLEAGHEDPIRAGSVR